MMLIANRDFAVLVRQIRTNFELAWLRRRAVDFVRVLWIETAEFHFIARQDMTDVWPIFGNRKLKHFISLDFENMFELVAVIQTIGFLVHRVVLSAKTTQRKCLDIKEWRVVFDLSSELIAFQSYLFFKFSFIYLLLVVNKRKFVKYTSMSGTMGCSNKMTIDLALFKWYVLEFKFSWVVLFWVNSR